MLLKNKLINHIMFEKIVFFSWGLMYFSIQSVKGAVNLCVEVLRLDMTNDNPTLPNLIFDLHIFLYNVILFFYYVSIFNKSFIPEQ